MTVLIILAIFSGIGMAVIFIRLLAPVRKMPEGELEKALRLSKPVLFGLNQTAFTPLADFWQNKLVPIYYVAAEKCIHKIRVFMEKISRRLSRLDDYIHGKTQPKGNGGSEYWNNINDFEKGLDEDRPASSADRPE